jgi:hypothetical protein
MRFLDYMTFVEAINMTLDDDAQIEDRGDSVNGFNVLAVAS